MNKIKIYSIILSQLLFYRTVFCDYPWTQSVQVSITPGSNESSIAVKYPYIYVAYNSAPVKFNRSTDGGLTWGTTETFFGTSGVDPSIAVDELGNIHLVIMYQFYEMRYYRSTNAGLNWNSPIILNDTNENVDKCWLSVHNNKVYISWISNEMHNAYIAVSTNRGISFSPQIRVNDENSGGVRWFTMHKEDPKNPNTVFYMISCDNRFVNWQVFLAKSTNGGFNWLPNTPLPDTAKSNNCGGFMPYASYSTMDISPIYNDIYFAWCDVSNPQPPYGKLSLYTSRSTDNGLTFSRKVKLQGIPVPDTSYRFEPMIHCDQYGTVHIAWYDSRRYNAGINSGTKSTYYTFSMDRGLTWAAHEKVSDTSDSYNFTFFGHYLNIVTDHKRAFAVWCERRNGNEQIYFSNRILPKFLDINIQSANVNDYGLDQNFPNPFNPKTKIIFNIPQPNAGVTQNVQLIIYDARGKEVERIVDDVLSAGQYAVSWDASNYPSGVYFYKLITDEYSVSKKMILVK